MKEIKNILMVVFISLIGIFGIAITCELANIHQDNIESNKPMYEKYYEWDMANTGEVLYDNHNAGSWVDIISDGIISKKEFDQWLTLQ